MKKLFKFLKLNNWTISSCESFTGGFFANQFTNISESSDYFLGGFVCYSNDFKHQILNVDIEVIKKYGPVSRETLTLMLDNTYNLVKADITVGFTGYAPGKSENPLNGLSYIGFKFKNKNYIFKFEIKENISREKYKKLAVEFIIDKIINL